MLRWSRMISKGNINMKAPIEFLPQAIEVLRNLGARKILLFGSAAVSPETAKDIDLAVEGIPLSRLLEADVAVHDIFQFPTDLVSYEENPSFFEIIRRYGRVVYEQG